MNANNTPSSTVKKPAQYTLPISTAVPTSQAALNAAIGWQGATSCGVSQITVPTTAQSWELKVYEVNPTTGVMLSGAPILVDYTGVGNFTAANYAGSKQFDLMSSYQSDYVAPFYAKPGTNYFTTLYGFAQMAIPGYIDLPTFSAKVFCIELDAYLPATATKKAYFRITNDGTQYAKSWRILNPSQNTNPINTPNPASNYLTITSTNIKENSTMQIFDNMGRQVQNHKLYKSKETIGSLL